MFKVMPCAVPPAAPHPPTLVNGAIVASAADVPLMHPATPPPLSDAYMTPPANIWTTAEFTEMMKAASTLMWVHVGQGYPQPIQQHHTYYRQDPSEPAAYEDPYASASSSSPTSQGHGSPSGAASASSYDYDDDEELDIDIDDSYHYQSYGAYLPVGAPISAPSAPTSEASHVRPFRKTRFKRLLAEQIRAGLLEEEDDEDYEPPVPKRAIKMPKSRKIKTHKKPKTSSRGGAGAAAGPATAGIAVASVVVAPVVVAAAISPSPKKSTGKKRKAETQEPTANEDGAPAATPATPAHKRAKKADGRRCAHCDATVTPMWRHGPVGYDDLCNKVTVAFESLSP
ncbi:hypothetical protein BDK51DRAFT_30497 [Blyttiomyces helicus]|uniref:GATA-type domain-containing protein n=1 Tax=Blyttiomyces helicus TaxID=388810 RepID=A0A4P9WHR5_9FUNG|nr:hypothetical protein BDK51DRAFT_30497 [Blyttiomyces helicus]|eukprot:RKO90086.1 hypothetical protein BDK51DRAFT_30497 [Blyttiomyces helicus]